MVKRYYVDKDADAREHPQGYLVSYEDYAALEKSFFASNRAIAALEAERDRLQKNLDAIAGLWLCPDCGARAEQGKICPGCGLNHPKQSKNAPQPMTGERGNG